VATRTRRTRRRRLSAEEGRQALLDAGREYVLEHPLGEPLDHVRVTDIVARIGLSIGAVYHYWESQDDYRDDLLDLLLSPDQFPAVQVAGEAAAEAVEEGIAAAELVRLLAGISFQGLAESPDRERLSLALIAYGDAEIDQRLAAQAREVSRRWADLLTTLLPRYGLEPRPPFTAESLATALMALVEGMHLRWTIDPDAVGEVEPGWDLFATSTCALVLSATRQVGDERGLLDVAQEVATALAPDG
jgi:AcrR family transcriptional regulator